MKESILPWILFGAVVAILLLATIIGAFIDKVPPQGAYIISSQGETYYVDKYHKSNDCIEFLHQGETVTACGDFQIKSNRGGEQSE